MSANFYFGRAHKKRNAARADLFDETTREDWGRKLKTTT
jgi:hypothetical protein